MTIPRTTPEYQESEDERRGLYARNCVNDADNRDPVYIKLVIQIGESSETTIQKYKERRARARVLVTRKI